MIPHRRDRQAIPSDRLSFGSRGSTLHFMNYDLVIDGYNLLHHSPFLTRDRSRGWLDRARTRLLDFVAQAASTKSSTKVAVVFDPSKTHTPVGDDGFYSGIRVFFADKNQEADDLIENLIRNHPHPHSLTVVSSDHRIHGVARRRHALAVDSDAWLESLSHPHSSLDAVVDDEEEKPQEGMSEEEKQRWLDEFMQ